MAINQGPWKDVLFDLQAASVKLVLSCPPPGLTSLEVLLTLSFWFTPFVLLRLLCVWGQRRDLLKWAHRVVTQDGTIVLLMDSFELGLYQETARMCELEVEFPIVAEISNAHFGANGYVNRQISITFVTLIYRHFCLLRANQ
jgi:hypothetical protein